jgi:uncharacterized membrane protein
MRASDDAPPPHSVRRKSCWRGNPDTSTTLTVTLVAAALSVRHGGDGSARRGRAAAIALLLFVHALLLLLLLLLEQHALLLGDVSPMHVTCMWVAASQVQQSAAQTPTRSVRRVDGVW